MPSIGENAQEKIGYIADMLVVGAIESESQLKELGMSVKEGVPFSLSDIIGLRDRYLEHYRISDENISENIDAMAAWIEEKLREIAVFSIGSSDVVGATEEGFQVPLKDTGKFIALFPNFDFTQKET